MARAVEMLAGEKKRLSFLSSLPYRSRANWLLSWDTAALSSGVAWSALTGLTGGGSVPGKVGLSAQLRPPSVRRESANASRSKRSMIGTPELGWRGANILFLYGQASHAFGLQY